MTCYRFRNIFITALLSNICLPTIQAIPNGPVHGHVEVTVNANRRFEFYRIWHVTKNITKIVAGSFLAFYILHTKKRREECLCSVASVFTRLTFDMNAAYYCASLIAIVTTVLDGIYQLT